MFVETKEKLFEFKICIKCVFHLKAKNNVLNKLCVHAKNNMNYSEIKFQKTIVSILTLFGHREKVYKKCILDFYENLFGRRKYKPREAEIMIRYTEKKVN